jgi:hypothetical protein
VISFRYHIVSIIGIFLAIALGVVIGTSALNGAVVGDLRRQVTDLKAGNASAADRNRALQAEAGNADLLAKSYGTAIAGKALAKQNVVILSTPGASSDLASAVSDQVAAAGGKVTATLQLTKDFTDPKRAGDIRSLATSNGSHPVGLQLPTTDDVGLLAGSLLGYVLLGHGQGTDLTQVLSSFTTLNMIKATGTPTPGTVLLVVTNGGLPKGDAGGQELLTMVTEIGAAGGPTVVVGDNASSESNGLIGLVRTNDTAKQAVSTVDNGNTALGQLSTVLVAKETLAGRKGHYGTGTGVDALMPGVTS